MIHAIRFTFDGDSAARNKGVAGVEQTITFEGHYLVSAAIPQFLKGVAAMLDREDADLKVENTQIDSNENVAVWAPAEGIESSEDMSISERVGVMHWRLLSQDEMLAAGLVY